VLVNRCPLCSSSGRTFRVFSEKHVLSRCERCHFIFSSKAPTAEELAEFYREGYYRSWGLDEPDFLKTVRDMKVRSFKRWLRRIGRGPAGGPILDVGCATGFCMEAAEDLGWTAWGVELSEDGAKAAQARFGSRVIRGTLDNARFQDGFFDAVTMFDVIEHVADPKALLLEVRRILKPGGTIALTTPDVASLSARLMGRAWPNFKECEHLSFFDRKTIRSTLRELGFSSTRVASAVKTVNMRYVGYVSRAYGVSLLSAVGGVAAALPRRIAEVPIPLALGDMLVVGKRSVIGLATSRTP
jgi:SAM-dependent methyltransferase